VSDRPQLSREEIANIEIGHTDVTPWQVRVLVFGFLTIIAGVPVASWIADAATRAESRTTPVWSVLATAMANCIDIVRRSPEVPDQTTKGCLLPRVTKANSVLLRGMEEFETGLEDTSRLRAALLPTAQSVLTGNLGVGNEEVYTGLDGWLFYRPSIDYAIGPGFLNPRRLESRRRSGSEWKPPPQPDPVLAILDFQAQLAQCGVRLILVPTPIKATVHPEKFSVRYPADAGPVQNLSYNRFVAELRNPQLFFDGRFKEYAEVVRNPANQAIYAAAIDRVVKERERLCEAGVLVFDPADLLVRRRIETGEAQFIATDTHWTPDAMRSVATELARFIMANVHLGGAAGPTMALATARSRHAGDLVDMLHLPAAARLYPPVELDVQPIRIDEQPQTSPDADAEILLLGDSFSNIFSDPSLKWGEQAGLAEHLRYALKRRVDAIRQNGGGAGATRAELATDLRRGNDRLAGKKVVVWQVATRELASGDWQLINLDLRLLPKREPPVLEKGVCLVSGIIQGMAPLPRPGASPYKDHIIWLHLTEIEDNTNAFPSDHALVYVRSMADDKLTAIASVRQGQRIAMRLRPWEDVAKAVGRIRREDPEDDDLLLEDPYWGELHK